MLRRWRHENAFAERLSRALRLIFRKQLYGLEWGDPDVVSPLQFIRDKYVLPFVNSAQVAVEIGPGGGRWTRYLLGFKTLYAVDFHQELLDQLKRNYSHLIIDTIEFRGVRQLTFEHAEKVAEKVLALFADGAFDVATLFYSRFRSVISQVPTAQQIIPATISADTSAAEAALGGGVYEYEPDEAEILSELLPLNITVQIFKALLENGASFYGAQMSAMDNATRNAGDMIGRLTLRYNRTRQAMITKELIEIISGAEAV